jgi:hypothetical protein
VKHLMITYSCFPDVDGSKGILYWLGTKKGTENYINPFFRGAIYVTGWFERQRNCLTKRIMP